GWVTWTPCAAISTSTARPTRPRWAYRARSAVCACAMPMWSNSSTSCRRTRRSILAQDSRQALAIRIANDAVFANDRRDQLCRRDVEGRVPDLHALGRPAQPAVAGHFLRRPFLDLDRRTVRALRIEGRGRRRDVEGQAMPVLQYRNHVSADLVRGVAVHRDTVRADDDDVHFPLAHEVPGHVVRDQGAGDSL